MEKKDWAYSIESATKALVALIPIGSIAVSLYNDAIFDRKEQRIKETIDTLRSDLDKHKLNINIDFINKVDFLDISDKLFRRISEERGTTKRVAYKNILLNAIISEKSDFYSVEQQIILLDQLSEEHLLLLSFFKSPKELDDKYSEEKGKISAGTLKRYLNALFPQFTGQLLEDLLFDLENRRLIKEFSKNLMTMQGTVEYHNFVDGLTPRGEKLISYIINV